MVFPCPACGRPWDLPTSRARRESPPEAWSKPFHCLITSKIHGPKDNPVVKIITNRPFGNGFLPPMYGDFGVWFIFVLTTLPWTCVYIMIYYDTRPLHVASASMLDVNPFSNPQRHNRPGTVCLHDDGVHHMRPQEMAQDVMEADRIATPQAMPIWLLFADLTWQWKIHHLDIITT